MSTKNVAYESQVIDLLQKILIVKLYNSGVTRDEIKNILGVSPNKISSITKFLKATRRGKNEWRFNSWNKKNE